MFEYRVSKYDPSLRDQSGAYRRDDWSAFSDIGRSFDGLVFTADEYQRVEDAYVAATVGFWREVGRPALVVRGVENPSLAADPPREGSAVDDDERLTGLVRRVLREELWCRLESERCFVHFGRDYYLYVGVANACSESCAFAAAAGLFVETRVSPYHPRSER
jgi:hypothetical protein